MSEGDDRVQVEHEEDRVVVSLLGAGFQGTARTVLLVALALPWLVVGPAFVLLLGNTIPGWVVVVGAVGSGLLGFGLSFFAILLATRTHHISVDEQEVRFWTDAMVGSVSRDWPREVVATVEAVESDRGGVVEIVAANGDRLALPISREFAQLRDFAAAASEALTGDPGG
ncbi:MAG: hypothetical protein ACNA8P_07325 [Phycisphaerales bacterium]